MCRKLGHTMENTVSMDIHSGIAAGWDGENDSGCGWNMVVDRGGGGTKVLNGYPLPKGWVE